MGATLIIIGPSTAELSDSHALRQAGYDCYHFNNLDEWWTHQPEDPKAFILSAQQANNSPINGFELCRVIKRMPIYQTLPVIVYEPSPATCTTQQYECHMDAYCISMDDMVKQLKTLTTMYNRVWSPLATPLPFSQVAHAWDYHITHKQLQSDLHQLTALLPDISASVHMAFSLLERIFPYQAAGLLLCGNHALIQNIFYVTVPYGHEALAPLSQQFLASSLTEKLTFHGVLRIEDLAGTVTHDIPFRDFPLQLVWPFTQTDGAEQKLLGALAFWGNTPMPNTDLEKTVQWWFKDWFKQVTWIRQLQQGEYLDTTTQTYQHAYLMRQLNTEVQRAKRYEHPICMLKVIVDQMDAINVRFGFDAGDQVLRTTAELIQSSIRSSDTLGRFRTNEFLVLMPETSLEEAETASRRILERVADTVIPLTQPNTSCQPQLRIGVTCLLDGHGEAEDLLKSAHQAMLAANDDQRMFVSMLAGPG